jgi:hypothetical protein
LRGESSPGSTETAGGGEARVEEAGFAPERSRRSSPGFGRARSQADRGFSTSGFDADVSGAGLTGSGFFDPARGSDEVDGTFTPLDGFGAGFKVQSAPATPHRETSQTKVDFASACAGSAIAAHSANAVVILRDMRISVPEMTGHPLDVERWPLQVRIRYAKKNYKNHRVRPASLPVLILQNYGERRFPFEFSPGFGMMTA